MKRLASPTLMAAALALLGTFFSLAALAQPAGGPCGPDGVPRMAGHGAEGASGPAMHGGPGGPDCPMAWAGGVPGAHVHGAGPGPMHGHGGAMGPGGPGFCAGGPGLPGGHGMLHGSGGLPPEAALKGVFGLSDSQMASLKSLGETRRASFEALQKKIADGRKALDEALNAASPEAAKVGQALLAVRGLEKQMPKVDESYRSGFKALLNADQKQKLVEIEARRAAAILGRAGL